MEEIKVKYHLFLFADLEQEEKWINGQQLEGYQLVEILSGFKYIFKKVESDFIPTVRIDYREMKNQADYEDYLALFEDMGWQLLKGSRWNGYRYFQQSSPETEEFIYSSPESQAQLYKRYSMQGLMWIPFYLLMMNSALRNYSNSFFLNPKSAYLTQGLWERQGTEFWQAFLFETPFALLRIFSDLFWVVMLIYFVYRTLSSYLKYRQLNQKDKS
ncbi:DUF2812 domain-containing protein [Facklamia sp. DSM 111018]|uniref:DUF2812 domain-containing protein n=1 Tax=Facklamia lactis TaxID=2749967 RepID=A0ABS0LUP7_9LACT|nr:DUF2812 domain-containing protein [Facklamia lactis]MBG9981232.1 DUF2812 domain-containing protein [Facklamia lactis]MBG9987034.1 DUF2812 domain-containing protein [Facklamia lactis]